MNTNFLLTMLCAVIAAAGGIPALLQVLRSRRDAAGRRRSGSSQCRHAQRPEASSGTQARTRAGRQPWGVSVALRAALL
jgi:hypothetical protein